MEEQNNLFYEKYNLRHPKNKSPSRQEYHVIDKRRENVLVEANKRAAAYKNSPN